MILGVEGKHHPFSLYRRFGVSVALSTDDEGISRIDLTHEYVRAVESCDLSYANLKHIVRNSLEYTASCLARAFGRRRTMPAWRARARATALRTKSPSGCDVFLKGSEKAAQQWELENRFRAFEAGF